MLTYANLSKISDTISDHFVDDDTPDSTFGVTARVMGIPATYLFVGDPQLPSFTVCVGRIEHVGHGNRAYSGGNVKGGYYLGQDMGSAEAFSSMLIGR